MLKIIQKYLLIVVILIWLPMTLYGQSAGINQSKSSPLAAPMVPVNQTKVEEKSFWGNIPTWVLIAGGVVVAGLVVSMAGGSDDGGGGGGSSAPATSGSGTVEFTW
jgi:hypothetical protein